MAIKHLMKLAVTSIAAATLVACGGSDQAEQGATASSAQTYEWKMVTTWPKNFPALGTGAENVAKNITEMSGGRIQVKVYAAGELVPALEVFDAVSRGTAQLGHGAAYYWKGKAPAAQFFASVPFGLTAQEMNAWVYHGGGLEIWEEIYKPFGVIPMSIGNTGVQMGGWFNKEINSVADFQGLKMRIPGLGGEVLKKVGGTSINLPGGEIFTALQTGTIDATEFIGPYNDLAFGLHKAAKYYYYPGWHEPGLTLEMLINEEAFAALPADLQAIVRAAARQANQDMLDEYTARNNDALNSLVQEHNVQLRPFPEDVLAALKVAADETLEEVAATDELSKKAYDSFVEFRKNVRAWHEISERAYINARDAD